MIEMRKTALCSSLQLCGVHPPFGIRRALANFWVIEFCGGHMHVLSPFESHVLETVTTSLESVNSTTTYFFDICLTTEIA